jgi:PilZ domain
MKERRTSERVDCVHNCHLKYNDRIYKCTLENLSNSGALIKLTSQQQKAIPDGSVCSLVIGNSTLFIPGEFTGTVVYASTARVGIRFQFME